MVETGSCRELGGDNDVFHQVTFIQRVLTHGARRHRRVSRPKGCDTVSVPYTALYVSGAAGSNHATSSALFDPLLTTRLIRGVVLPSGLQGADQVIEGLQL